MFSVLHPGFLYTDISSDITETDLDIVADTWEIDGREVYRGVRDPRYDHASVFWLYDDNLERVGCAEHSLKDHADMRALWFRDSEFGTLLQEDGWTEDGDLWSKIPRHVFDRFLNEGWTTPESFLEHCLHGPVRIVVPSMLVVRPTIHTCLRCGRKSLRPLPTTCESVREYLDFPDKQKVFCIDFDFVVHRPPQSTRLWELLTPSPCDDSASQAQVQERAQEPVQAQEPQQPELRSPPEEQTPPPHTTPAEFLRPLCESEDSRDQEPPAQSHRGTHPPQSSSEEEQPSHS